MLLKKGDKLGEYIILDVYDPIYIDEYKVEYCRVGEKLSPNSIYCKVAGKRFIVIYKGKNIFISHLMTGSGWKEYIYEAVFELQKKELNATLGL